MLKNILITFSMLVGSSAFAASNYDICMDSLTYHFLANYRQSSSICKQNSSPKFVKCMEKKAVTTNLHVTDAAPECSKQVKATSVFNTCESRLQVYTQMSDERSVQVCQWDPSPLMQSCIIDLVQKARFHEEHAVQYCAFANSEYRREIPRFKMCVIDQSRRGYDVYSSVASCHDYIMNGGRWIVTEPEPRPRPRPDRRDSRNDRNNREEGQRQYDRTEEDSRYSRTQSQQQAPVRTQPQTQSQPQVVEQRTRRTQQMPPAERSQTVRTYPVESYPANENTEPTVVVEEREVVREQPTRGETTRPAQSETNTSEEKKKQPEKNKTGATSSKVPAPVEIKVQESSKPKVEDQPLDSESTENAESLPIN